MKKILKNLDVPVSGSIWAIVDTGTTLITGPTTNITALVDSIGAFDDGQGDYVKNNFWKIQKILF